MKKYRFGPRHEKWYLKEQTAGFVSFTINTLHNEASFRRRTGIYRAAIHPRVVARFGSFDGRFDEATFGSTYPKRGSPEGKNGQNVKNS